MQGIRLVCLHAHILGNSTEKQQRQTRKLTRISLILYVAIHPDNIRE